MCNAMCALSYESVDLTQGLAEQQTLHSGPAGCTQTVNNCLCAMRCVPSHIDSAFRPCRVYTDSGQLFMRNTMCALSYESVDLTQDLAEQQTLHSGPAGCTQTDSNGLCAMQCVPSHMRV